MKVSYQWLSEYVDITGYSAQDLAELLTRGGIEVDVVESRNKGIEQVVVGYVTEREKHPDADKLNVCKVDIGSGEQLQIVCGAPNVDAGQKVPVAVVGARLPEGLKIKRAKLRGVESQGMICSAKELGMNDRLLPKEIQEGILVLPDTAVVGSDILDVLSLNDEVLELDLTPNRSDCLSMLGVAYEIATLLGREVRLPNVQQGLRESETDASGMVQIEISAQEQCSHYAARIIEGVTIAPSPLWMQNRLMAAGIRPINNVVDITNYVMLEYGQPLHAFDADRLAGGRIDVRLAGNGERFVTLDDVERELKPHMLVIADGEKGVALAGVMGGANSEVTGATTRIMLEAAKFDGGAVRKTSRELGLRSESSLRFEKEVDPARVLEALDRAASLMCQHAGGTAAKGISEKRIKEVEPLHVVVSRDKINRYLGTSLSAEQIGEILAKLRFPYQEADGSFMIEVPTRRGDIALDVDIIEEIARLYGYDQIPTTWIEGATTPGALTASQRIRRSLRELLSSSGLLEATNYSFVQPDQIRELPGLYPQIKPIALAMPMSEERSVMRTSLLPQLVEMAVYNRNRNVEDLAVFEFGRIFLTEQEQLTELPREREMLGVLLTGHREPLHWRGKPAKADFYDIKGVADQLMRYLGLETRIRYEALQADGFHPGRTAGIYLSDSASRTLVGIVGQLHPELQKAKDLAETYVLELELDALYEHVSEEIAYQALPRFPAVSRDIAVVVNESVAVGDLLETVRASSGELLESLSVFDIYQGEHLGAGKKSVALSLVFRHAERTLQDEEITEQYERIVHALASGHGAELRK
ncbi:phenylalanine--tRNA ligase subunit beta [Xylanibacillus composti]|uniref:Phenylalanine--tRNA ligase beta subunit n=1 Tax=Xylanibacillus composti TaxID=1572762 RepID=A0A8J4M4A2_9BACL|nr:phenylalanine--tRNA ligase subunit beta [Xylanibacillus composti]MDT9724672.1 phenylalanine--tRNA ligase subunit beta [Xylanibacillus composti]GIQ70957.1 phenylalanine--tRNA ligase beta subunit [Xylanibacillus composti]